MAYLCRGSAAPFSIQGDSVHIRWAEVNMGLTGPVAFKALCFGNGVAWFVREEKEPSKPCCCLHACIHSLREAPTGNSMEQKHRIAEELQVRPRLGRLLM